MADSATPGNSTSSRADTAATSIRKAGRDRLARLVVVGSFLTIFALVGAMLLVSQGQNESSTAIAERAFTTILPVLAGWVGSVLAFYFSAASLEATTSSLERAISGSSSTPSLSVSEKMIPLGSIRGVFDLSETKPDQITITNLKERFANDSRLVFVEKDQFRYVMHQSALNAFQVKNPPAGDSTTFEAMLQDADLLVQISKLVVFVKASATLAEAKDALGAVAGAQDVIVTTNGGASGAMIGWLTNVDLTKSMTA